MADEKVTLEIVTPKGRAVREQVDYVAAPSAGGEIGVLAGHLPLAGALRAGIVTFRSGGEEKQIAIGDGFVEIKDDEVRILTDKVATRAEIDPVKVRLELKDVGELLDRCAGLPGSPEYGELLSREQWAAVQLELNGDPPHPVRRPADEPAMPEPTASPDETQ
jgi:F-type H+-transporting ATPase subunit epsilon